MDPDAALADLMDALTMDEWDDALDAVENLQDWLDKGGSPPSPGDLGWRNLMDGIQHLLEEVT